MTQESDAQQTISSGVEELIDRLKADGVAAGREEAQALLEHARAEAEQLLEAKRAEADRYREEAAAAIEAQQKAAASALEQATRDSLLMLEKQVHEAFGRRVEEAIRRHLEDPDFLRTMVLIATHHAGGHLSEEARAVIELPQRLADPGGESEGASGAGSSNSGTNSGNSDAILSMLSMTEEMLREGLSLRAGTHEEGIVLRLSDRDVAINLSPEALSSLVLEQLAPSFRDLLRGHLEPEENA